MKLERILISAAIVIICVEFLTADSGQNIAALVMAVLVHELGHLFAIILMGMKVTDIHVEPCGLCLDYAGVNSNTREIIAALAGPFMGMLFFRLSLYSKSALLMLSGRLSLLYSVFNLLPAKPLDGGRIFAHLAETMLGDFEGARISKLASAAISILLMIFGFIYSIKGEGNALFAAGLWLVMLQSQN